MRPTRLNARLPVVAALGAALAATALVGTAKAGDDDRPIDQQIIHNIMTGLGFQDPNAVQPTYEERPPLVIPKNDALPPPQKPGAAIAENPAWPKDPDVQRAKALAKHDKNRDVEAEILRESDPLRPDQIGPRYPGRRTASGAPLDNSAPTGYGYGHRMSPSELGYHGGLFGSIFGSDDKAEQTARFTSEPARTSLTEPPPGYQTPAPDQPYGIGPAVSAPKADKSYTTRGELSPD